MDIKTDRLYIRDLRKDDWPEMKRIFADFSRSEYAAYDRPLPAEDEGAKALTEKFAGSRLFFTVHLLESGKMIGYVCFHRNGDIFDLGYCFHSAYHANGYAYESTSAVIEYFAKERGAANFTAETALDNVPSRRLLEKLGFVHTSTETISFDGSFSFQSGKYVLTRS